MLPPRSLDELLLWHPVRVADWARLHLDFDEADAGAIVRSKISGRALLSGAMTLEILKGCGMCAGPACVLLGAVAAIKTPEAGTGPVLGRSAPCAQVLASSLRWPGIAAVGILHPGDVAYSGEKRELLPPFSAQ